MTEEQRIGRVIHKGLVELAKTNIQYLKWGGPGGLWLDNRIKRGGSFSPALAWAIVFLIQHSITMDQALEFAKTLRASAYKWVRSYDGNPAIFKHDWLVARNLLPLQARLFVEQVLYDYGKGQYRYLVTGFKPIA